MKLGFNDTNNALDISFFDSGSLSIVNVIHLLSIIDIHHIAIISPSYFSVEHICKDYLIECHYIDLERKTLCVNTLRHFLTRIHKIESKRKYQNSLA